MSKRKKIIAIMIVIAVVLLVGLFGYGIWKKYAAKETAKENTEEYEDESYITYKGKRYEYNYHLKNMLFIGVDKSQEMTETEVGQGGQADTLILLSMDRENKTTTLLQIPRDAMTDIDIYDINGEYLSTERGQISLQYAYGDGKKKSCRMMMTSVSELLYEIPIDSYLALGVDGIADITNLMGGVTLTVPEDYTDIDPAFKAGETIVLAGEQAEKYVRYRDVNVSGSNTQRMERQAQFMEALARQMQGKDTGWYRQLLEGAKEYITMDLSVDEMERMKSYEMKETIEKVPGEVKQGEEHDEFIVDNEKLRDLVIKLFYKPVE